MANRRIEFTEEQVRELQAAMKKNKHKNIERRLCVVWMKKEKKSIAEIVARTGYSQSHARAIITKYFKEGISAITENKYKGNHRNISYEEEKAFVESFKKRANEGEYTTVKDIKKKYEELVGHSIGSGHIYTILNRHKCRKIKPRPVHPNKASEAEIEASKKLTLG